MTEFQAHTKDLELLSHNQDDSLGYWLFYNKEKSAYELFVTYPKGEK